jgi:integration host factor subunit alpha
MSTITRERLAQAIKRATGIPVTKGLDLVDGFFDTISENLADNKKVKIRGFGSFESRKRAARMGRNPRNLIAAIIPERRVVKFKISNIMKLQIQKTKALIG